MILLPFRRFLIRDDELSFRVVVDVIVLGMALRDDGETKKNGEPKCKIQNRNSPRVSDLLVYSSMVSIKV